MKTTQKWLGKNTYGLCDMDTGEISINLYLFLADVAIHEDAHRQYPFWSENRVLKYTARKLSRMSIVEIQELGRKVLKEMKGV